MDILQALGTDLKDFFNYCNVYRVTNKDIDFGAYTTDLGESIFHELKKAYSIYKQTGLCPTLYFEQNPKIAFSKDIKIFEILWEKDELKNRIAQRTKIMIENGLIDEVIFLEKTYTREPNCMSSIGIVETLEYLDGKLSKTALEEKISANTIKLAKRQNTFNKSQFTDKISNNLEDLNSDILKYFSIQSTP